MRAIVVPRLGGPEVLTLREVPQPAPAAGEVLVKIKYAGITFGDVYQREGTYRAGKPLLATDAAAADRRRGGRARLPRSARA